MKKSTLPELISFLNHLNQDDFDQKVIDRYLADHHIAQEEFAPFIFFREETYGRNLVSRNKFYELLVLTWLPGQSTPIHDHADQKCWMVVQSGKLTVRNYKPVATSATGLIPCGPVEVHSTGDWIYIDDGIGIHSISNASSKPSVSIHLYAAPISECRIYDEQTKDFQWVELRDFTADYSSLDNA